MSVVFKQKAITDALNKFYEKPIAWISLELIFSLVLVITLAVFAIQPTLMTMSDLTKEISDKEVLAKELDKKIAALGTAQAVYSSIENTLPALEEAIPSQPHILSLLKVLEKTATDNSVIVSGISLSAIPDDEPVTEDQTRAQLTFTTNIVVTADYRSIRAYVEALKNYKRVLLIDRVTFATQEDRGDKKLQASIVLEVPYFGVKK